MPEPRRKQYRVEGPPLSVALQLIGPEGAGGEIHEARLDDLTISGARLRVTTVTGVGHGAPVRLILDGGGLPTPLWLTARTTRRELVGLDTAYGLRFDDARAVEALLTPELLRLFNRRCAERVGPLAGEPAIPVAIEVVAGADATSEVWRGHLLDVSTSGAGVQAPPDVSDEVALSFALPLEDDSDAPADMVRVTGKVVSRSATEGGERLGIELSPPAEDVREILLQYVTRQQRRR